MKFLFLLIKMTMKQRVCDIVSGVCAGVAAVQDRLAYVRGREAVQLLRGGVTVPAVGAPRPRAHLQDGRGMLSPVPRAHTLS